MAMSRGPLTPKIKQTMKVAVLNPRECVKCNRPFKEAGENEVCPFCRIADSSM